MTSLRRSFALPIAALLTMLAGCVQPSASSRHADATNAPNAAGQRPDAPSLYDLTSTWTDQRGTERPLASLRGRPRAVAMVYTHCTATCPLALGELKRIAAATDTSVGLVLVTLDPARDTPSALATYAQERGLDASRWTLLAGSDDDVRELAAALSVRYRTLGPDAIAHSNVITLLDASGVIVHRQSGFDGTADAIRIARTLSR